MEDKKFKKYSRNEGDKFLAHIRAGGQQYTQWEYKAGCFLIWSNGILGKQEGEIKYAYIEGRGWVAY